jgi:hypothetical protein
MKKYRKKIVALLLLGFGITTVYGQQATTTTGGNASGSGGTVAYSVGQVVYNTNTGTTNGSVAQGVQQAYEISSVGVNETELNISLQAYPNPTTDYLQLKVESEKLKDLSFQLVDMAGKLIESKKITNTTETIRMENLPSASYFLKVCNDNKEVKSFKIIKH